MKVVIRFDVAQGAEGCLVSVAGNAESMWALPAGWNTYISVGRRDVLPLPSLGWWAGWLAGDVTGQAPPSLECLLGPLLVRGQGRGVER